MSSIDAAYNWMIALCNDPNVGYAGGTAPGAVPASWRDMSVHDGKQYVDCSSAIWFSLLNGGWDLSAFGSWPFTTYTMSPCLSSLGFVLYDPVTTPWVNGDILVFPGDMSQGTGHTEMVYDGAAYVTMGAHSSWPAFADQVSINNYSTDPLTMEYTELWRAPDGPIPPPGPYYRVPVWLIKKAIEHGRK